jgi:hypothetical protein
MERSENPGNSQETRMPIPDFAALNPGYLLNAKWKIFPRLKSPPRWPRLAWRFWWRFWRFAEITISLKTNF